MARKIARKQILEHAAMRSVGHLDYLGIGALETKGKRRESSSWDRLGIKKKKEGVTGKEEESESVETFSEKN